MFTTVHATVPLTSDLYSAPNDLQIPSVLAASTVCADSNAEARRCSYGGAADRGWKTVVRVWGGGRGEMGLLRLAMYAFLFTQSDCRENANGWAWMV